MKILRYLDHEGGVGYAVRNEAGVFQRVKGNIMAG